MASSTAVTASPVSSAKEEISGRPTLLAASLRIALSPDAQLPRTRIRQGRTDCENFAPKREGITTGLKNQSPIAAGASQHEVSKRERFAQRRAPSPLLLEPSASVTVPI